MQVAAPIPQQASCMPHPNAPDVTRTMYLMSAVLEFSPNASHQGSFSGFSSSSSSQLLFTGALYWKATHRVCVCVLRGTRRDAYRHAHGARWASRAALALCLFG
jgi:hypothetical protein